MATVLERTSKIKNSAGGKAPRAQARPKKSVPESAEKLLTAEEYWETCDIENSELINGKVVERMPPGGEHGEIAGIILSALLTFVRKHKLGRVFVESGFRLGAGSVLSPDVSFVPFASLPDGRAPRAFIEGTPTLAAEVVSPGDLWSEVEDKVQLYLEAGTEVVWIVDPKTESVTVRTKSNSRVYPKTETLPGEPILPGFKLPLKEIFS
jgi:Uma2 family endonuclease